MYSELILSDIENFLQGKAGEPLTRDLLYKAATMLRLQHERIAELRRTMGDTGPQGHAHALFMSGEISL